MSATKEAPAVQSPPGELSAGEVDAAVAEFQAAISNWETSVLSRRSVGPLVIDSELVNAARDLFAVVDRAGTEGASQSRMEMLMLLEVFRQRLAEWISQSRFVQH